MKQAIPYEQLRRDYWQYLTEFKDNHGYMNRSHTYDNFKKFLTREGITENDLETTIQQTWNWYFV